MTKPTPEAAAPQLGLATFESEVGAALELGGRALAWTEQHARPLLASASFTTQALVLGALQRQDTLQGRSPARFDLPVRRRRSTGTEAQLDGAVLYHALALPRVDSLFADASSRTLLNRNLRAILRGYTAAGVPLRYFGTEVLALLGQPVALVGYDQTESGAVLIEVLIGLDAPCVVRSALAREAPAALEAVMRRSLPAHDLLRSAVHGIVERLGATAVDATDSLPTVPALIGPELFSPPASVPIPLGVVEAITQPNPRFTGDLLVSTCALGRVEALAGAALAAGVALSEAVLAPLAGAPLDGARPADLLQALREASRPTPSS
ncbi:MAG TPA: hypothetical protein VNG33_15400 [Polyangiaceae bacterium]|nr:hypothetical protein [Polyangiaceae bacterium]